MINLLLPAGKRVVAKLQGETGERVLTGLVGGLAYNMGQEWGVGVGAGGRVWGAGVWGF